MWTGREGHTKMEKYSAKEKTRGGVQKEREEKQTKVWNHEVKRMKKGQAESNREFQLLNRPVFTKGASQKEKHH